ncbi:pyruvate dehydrogenase (acetyl-transferring) E1 component subunit alpha [Dactylosporangium sp. CA-092794]|uniref:pyruvate dehydrogenase (acetyl-transferring) E1 component subunit alpha n=1 Tax=Dactylosporangium sp. CA-092794 TaxID=3239929 RepID=UPI003D8B83E4
MSALADDEAVRLLTPEGERSDHPDYPLEVSADRLRGLYRDMVVARRVDAEGVRLQRQGELALWPSLLGQEAAQVGSARAVREGDHVFPSYRDHAVALCRGLPPLDVFTMYRGAHHGGWDPARHGFHLYTLVIGAQVLHATGYAMGMAADGAESAVIVYFGDGATSQGDVNEALNFAAVYQAPVVFFCQNNQWAISAPVERQTRAPIHRRAAGFGLPGVRVDGNDVLACLAVTEAALGRARRGLGPMLIEAYTYRMGAHTTSDDPSRYRSAAEEQRWQRRDPIARLRTYLERNGLADEGYFAATDAEAERSALDIRAAVRAMPDPPPERMFADVYAGDHPLLAEERAWFAGYRSSFAGTGGGEA